MNKDISIYELFETASIAFFNDIQLSTDTIIVIFR